MAEGTLGLPRSLAAVTAQHVFWSLLTTRLPPVLPPAGVAHESHVDRTLPPHIKASLLSVRDWRGYKNPWMPEGGACPPPLALVPRPSAPEAACGSSALRAPMCISTPSCSPCAFPPSTCVPLQADDKVEYAYINLLRNSERYTGWVPQYRFPVLRAPALRRTVGVQPPPGAQPPPLLHRFFFHCQRLCASAFRALPRPTPCLHPAPPLCRYKGEHAARVWGAIYSQARFEERRGVQAHAGACGPGQRSCGWPAWVGVPRAGVGCHLRPQPPLRPHPHLNPFLCRTSSGM